MVSLPRYSRIALQVLMMDAGIVAVGLISELIIPLANGTFLAPPSAQSGDQTAADLAVVQMLKTLRALRAIRVLRMLTMFQDLWYVVQMFFFSLRPLLWTVIFIMIIIVIIIINIM